MPSSRINKRINVTREVYFSSPKDLHNSDVDRTSLTTQVRDYEYLNITYKKPLIYTECGRELYSLGRTVHYLWFLFRLDWIILYKALTVILSIRIAHSKGEIRTLYE
jgi:hypothetical protein